MKVVHLRPHLCAFCCLWRWFVLTPRTIQTLPEMSSRSEGSMVETWWCKRQKVPAASAAATIYFLKVAINNILTLTMDHVTACMWKVSLEPIQIIIWLTLQFFSNSPELSLLFWLNFHVLIHSALIASADKVTITKILYISKNSLYTTCSVPNRSQKNLASTRWT